MSVDLDAGFNQQNNSSCLAYWLAAADRPDFFGYQIYWGLTCSDRYMWVYSEATDWFARTAIPAGAEAAMQDAKTKVNGGLPLGLNIESRIQAAATAGGLEW